MRKLGLGLLGMTLLLLASCATIPQEKIDAARLALTNAETAEAELYASEALRAAQEKKAQLEAELKTQDDKWFKDYELTAKLSEELAQLAEQAKQAAAAGKAQAKSDAESAIINAESAIMEARDLLAGAPKGKGTKEDLAALGGDLDAAAASLEQAKSAVAEEDYFEAKAVAEKCIEKVDQVKNDVTAAIEMMKTSRRK